MRDLSSIDAVILAGGRGTRLRAVIQDRPKILARVDGHPFVFYLLDQLCEVGIRQVILCTGYMAEHVEEMIGDQYKTIQIKYSREESPLGTGGAIRKASGLIRAQWLLVMNGDSYINVDYHDLVAWHIRKKARCSIVLTSVNNADRYGVVKLNNNQEITDFVEKNDILARSGSSQLINAGIYFMHPSIPREFPRKSNLSLEREILPSLICDGIFGYTASGAFIDIGTPDSLQSAHNFFASDGRNINRQDLWKGN